MQTVETLNDGLKRGFTLTFTAGEIEARVAGEIAKLAPQVRMPGFRPGKVPTNLIRKMHGEAIHADALNASIQEGVQSLVAEKRLRPAMSPAVALADGYDHGKDATVTVSVEVLPDIEAPNVAGIKLERLTVEVSDDRLNEALEGFAAQQKAFEEAPKGHKAANGDLAVIDFAGTIDGVAFEGGKAEGASIEIGSGTLIPGFEEQLVGAKANDQVTVKVTFPENYSVAYLKGKDAQFAVLVNEIRTPKVPVVDEDFAKNLGLESLEQLQNLIKGQLEQDLNGLTRIHMKRRLLDWLANAHDFEVPPSMVEAEFEQIWAQLDEEAGREPDPESTRAEMEKDREDYRGIAVRRVRLGLLLSEIGRDNKIEVSGPEMSRLIQQAAQQYDPKDRARFVEYVQQDAMASAQLRAPLYEDKVVDFLFSTAEITDRAVTREELEAAIEAEEDPGHVHGPGCGHDHEAKPKAKKAAAPKAGAQLKAEAKPKKAKAAEVVAAPAEKPVKKAAAKKAK